MSTRLKKIPFIFLILFQVLPIAIAFVYIYDYNKLTENSGWLIESHTKCKFFTERNYENRYFTWDGDCKDGYLHGFGTLKMFENNIEYYMFEGYVLKGKIEGQGKLINLSDGDIYEGNYVNGKPNGFGHFYNDDGDHYEGNYKDGLQSGKGTYWYAPESELFKYVGEWQNGKKHGEGILFYRNGKKISGAFNNDILVEDN